MPIRSLQNIISVEKELFKAEQSAQEKIEQWLLAREDEIIAEHRAKREALAEKSGEIEKQAKQEAQEKATAIIRAADNMAAHLAGLGDETLEPVVRKHLPSILAGNFS